MTMTTRRTRRASASSSSARFPSSGRGIMPGRFWRHRGTMKTLRLRLTQIIRDSRIQPRERITATVVDEYAEAMAKAPVYRKAGLTVRAFPPIVVFHDRSDDGHDLYWLADGWHRLLAAEQAGHTDVTAEVAEGDRYAAMLFASGANATHGLRRSSGDKRRAVRMLLDHPVVIGEQWGNGQVSHHAGVSTWLTRTVRAERDADLGLPPVAERLGRDGKRYPGLRLRTDAVPEAPESPLEARTGAEPPTLTSDTGAPFRRLSIHQCHTEDCDAITTEPSWHCPTCRVHWPRAEVAEATGCPTCTQAVGQVAPAAVFAQLTAIALPAPAQNGHAPQAAYTPGHLGAPPESLALECLHGALDLLDTLTRSGASGAEIGAASPDPGRLLARLRGALTTVHSLVESLDAATAT